MPIQEKIELSITNDFKPIWKDFEKYVSKDKLFQKLLNEKVKNDKRIKFGKQRSIKTRYAISYYVRNMKRKELEQQKEEVIDNDST